MGERGCGVEDLGTLAQLVQSAALTEQRSLVRAQYVPLFTSFIAYGNIRKQFKT